MWEQVKEDLAFPNIENIFWLYVQGKCISIYNVVSFLCNFMSWHDPIDNSCIHVLPIKGACSRCKYGSQVLLWRRS
jgi:hypothetical protein